MKVRTQAKNRSKLKRVLSISEKGAKELKVYSTRCIHSYDINFKSEILFKTLIVLKIYLSTDIGIGTGIGIG